MYKGLKVLICASIIASVSIIILMLVGIVSVGDTSMHPAFKFFLLLQGAILVAVSVIIIRVGSAHCRRNSP
jgi:hypothetical protein